jgi:multicomponent Na+:H+ antiporter subunit F
MEAVQLVTIGTILAGVLILLRRIAGGPTVLDRVLAVNVVGTKTIVLLALVGFYVGRPSFFVDIELAYALINFISTIGLLRYLERTARGAGRAEDGS